MNIPKNQTMNPLLFELTEPAGRRLTDAREYIREQQGDEAADRFLERVNEAFTEARTRVAEEIDSNEFGTPNRLPDESASKLYFQPIYRLEIQTAKRRRGTSTGLYFAYYALRHSVAGLSKPDTMRILSFRHSASRPIGEASEDDE